MDEAILQDGNNPPESTAAAAVPTKATQGPSSKTRESPPDSEDATDPDSLVDVENPGEIHPSHPPKSWGKSEIPRQGGVENPDLDFARLEILSQSIPDVSAMIKKVEESTGISPPINQGEAKDLAEILDKVRALHKVPPPAPALNP